MVTVEYTSEELVNEKWKPLPFPAWAHLYSVSNLGRVRRDVKGKGTHAGRIRHPSFDSKKYLQIGFGGRKNRITRKVHAVVMLAFVGARPEGAEVNHKDGNKGNPRLSNLEYVSHQVNMEHADKVLNVIRTTRARGDRNGSRKYPDRLRRGEGCSFSVLTESQVREIRRLYIPHIVGTHALAKKFGVNRQTIRGVVRRRTWAHVQ